jgi:hypothetical protein
MSAQTPTTPPVSWREVFGTTARLLTLRAKDAELNALTYKHLIFGLVCTWIVGVGRYWDNPRVGFLQHLGLGSVIYTFALSLLLWLIAWPLRPKNWTYRRVLTFVSLVSPPAILYAIPVEKMFSLNSANEINMWFLGIVALWRVVLLIFFLGVSSELDILSVLLATLLPLTLIVNTLTALNLEKAVFAFMGGLSERTPNDDAFVVLWIVSLLSIVIFIPLLISYLVVVGLKLVGRRRTGE